MSFSYICFITNERYLPGLKVLKHSLNSTNTIYPLNVVVKNNTSIDFFKKIANIVGENNIIKMNDIEAKISIRDEKYKHWENTFFKLNAAKLVKFDKIVLLDLDLLILKNIDDLFGWPHLSAATSGKIANPEWTMFNSGVLVIEPNIVYFDRLMSLIESTKNKIGTTIGDQDVFQESIPNWDDLKQLHLPEEYNEYYRCVGKLARTLKNGWNDIKVIHFWGNKKPWEYNKFELIKYYLKNLLHKRNDLNKCMRLYRKHL